MSPMNLSRIVLVVLAAGVLQDAGPADRRFPVQAAFIPIRPADSTLTADGKSILVSRFDEHDWFIAQWSLESGKFEKQWRLGLPKEVKGRLHRNGKHVIFVSTRVKHEKKIDPQNNQEYTIPHEFLKIELADFRADKVQGKGFEFETGTDGRCPSGADEREALILGSALISKDAVPKGDKIVPTSHAKVRPVAWSGDLGWILASGGLDSPGGLYDSRSGQILPLPGPDLATGQNWVGCFSGSRKVVAFATAPGEIAVADVPKGKPATLKGPQGIILAIGLNKDGTRAAALGDSGNLRMWDVKAGKDIKTLAVPAPGDRTSWIRFTPDDKFCVVVGRDGAYVLDGATGELLRKVETSPGGRWAAARGAARAASGSGRTLTGWTLGPLGPAWSRDLPDDVQRLWITPDGARIALMDGKDRGFLLDAADGKELATYSGPGQLLLGPAADAPEAFVRTDTKIRRVSASEVKWEIDHPADGEPVLTRDLGLLLVAGEKLTLIDPADGKPLGSSAEKELDVNHAELSPDGRTLAILRPSKRELVLMGRDGQVVKTVSLGAKAEIPAGSECRVTWASDGRWVFVASAAEIHVFGPEGKEEPSWRPGRASAAASVLPGLLVMQVGEVRILAGTGK